MSEAMKKWESKAIANMDKASAWLKSFANPDHVSHIGLYNEIPTMFFADFKHFQAAFAGLPATITEGAYSLTYHVIHDGIDFWSTTHKEVQPAKIGRTNGFVPHVLP